MPFTAAGRYVMSQLHSSFAPCATASAGRVTARLARAAVAVELPLPQDAVERRLRRDVDAAVGKPRHDLLRREVAMLRGVRDARDLVSFGFAQRVGGLRTGTSPPVLAAVWCAAPTLDRADAQPELSARRTKSAAGLNRLLDQRKGFDAVLVHVSPPSSPRGRRLFF